MVFLKNCKVRQKFSREGVNDVTSKLCEQGLITKEHIAMHANLILLFKPTLNSSTLVIKVFESSIQLFYAEILTVTL